MVDTSINALLVEDNPGDARLLRDMLVNTGETGIRLTHLPRLDEALERLDRAVAVEPRALRQREGLDAREREFPRLLVADRDKKLSLAGELLEKPLEIG